ncbi:hypothetical protein CcaverHIS002_0704470 [Cutaneotrichosporon cavernicola]|uniref:Symplekin n=1 Tax=Cutaneotrichosporon cavernicola TaxID=279322 RepID=A0AA48QYN6_9TREE|nr:uncharacterized protein CcaverHIS019_0704550 [Cutaneotrichosporon cavernicola]BEI87101.1 hypothetical protein CcaverHIS002_0704470 [Cutaneotrichosporon cavernicola]BEI94874.1 hypothetical protein CcaverHIS019_0704550 [Cutaneotrichosporon cavernicola]BEJ02647.1 hypothetical protein CcaverHIS631_0704420 [Cutaneotrichosporon cavernicola]BEJ10403.1 hypothetical protein CcaverHIS641_0704380 [Cutaneotrichosporon cavernicola]
MSLYADEEPELYGSASVGPTAPTDPLQALAEALTAESETPDQANKLLAAGSRFEEHPEKLPDLCTKLLPMVVDGPDSLLRAWTLDMLALTVGRAGLRAEIKLDVARESLEYLYRLLNTGSVATIRATIPIFATVYPMVFRYIATAGSAGHQLYGVFESSKARIVALVLDPGAQPQSAGVKAAAWKFVQKVLLVGTRAPSSDPRLRATASDVSIALVQPGSALNAQQLEQETTMLRTQLMTQLYSTDDPAILHPIINTFPPLAKTRPALAPLIIQSMASWTPSAMEASRRPAMQIRAVEKTLRAVMAHIAKHPPLVGFSAQLHDALSRQKQRMELAYAADMEERRQRRAKLASGKHPLEADAESSTAKRARLDVQPGSGDGKGRVMVDVSQFALEPVIDVVLHGLQAISDEMLVRAFDNAKQAIQDNDPDAVPVLASCLLGEDVKLEEDVVLNPLDMDLDDDELLMEPLEGELEEQVTITDFRLPPPEPLPLDEKTEIADSAVQRIWDTGSDLSHLADLKISDGPRAAVQPKEMWMLLLARISSRGGDDKRRLIGEFVARDFGSRAKFATVWLNEEWLAKRRSEKNQYEAGLLAILNAYIPTLDSKDQSLARFLVGLPELPEAAIDLLEPLCEDPDRMIVGYLSLRELAEHRPPVRPRALQTLLQLCTHPERKVRVMAITTVRRWVPNSPMSPTVISFALGVLRRLAVRSHLAVKEENGDTEEADEDKPIDGEKPAVDADDDQPMEDADIGETIDTKYLGPVDQETVSQHVELAFALSRRDPDLLDAIFSIYPKIPLPIQAKVEELLAPLIKSLGPSKKLLEILKAFPPGAEPLALRVVKTLSAEGSSGVLVPVIRSLLAERELDPRFIIPVIGELDKAEIDAQIPRIVSLLSQPDSRDVVRTAFASALQKMTPADLLVTLHSEKAGLKPTMDAIGICFSMTTVFRSDVLANAMQRIVDQPTPLPVCFVRTVIQAMRTYKSLVPFIANNALPKLVAKRIWEMPQLWDGFVHLVRLLGQASFGTLLQMPLEQIRDLVERQPALKAPLKTFVSNKPQARNQLASVLAD